MKNKLIHIYAVFLLVNLNCVISTNYDSEYIDYYDYDILPFWEGTHPINTAAPEESMFYNAAGVRFNWAKDNVAYFNVFISTSQLTNDGVTITNLEAVVAGTDSTYVETSGNTMGYLGPDAFYEYKAGEKTGTPFVFTAGHYYWVILGFSESGELTHSSEQTDFYIY
ncbi:MAG: hypothetical protein OEZ13_06200 [Spirochaetia bacterium]|nr:hypothetical protein [Spirochaetia bacterium]